MLHMETEGRSQELYLREAGYYNDVVTRAREWAHRLRVDAASSESRCAHCGHHRSAEVDKAVLDELDRLDKTATPSKEFS